MRLLHDLWTTAPRRTAAVLVLIVLGAAGSSLTAALAGQVLIHRSVVMFAALSAAVVAAVASDIAVGLIMAGVTADWAADVRRRLCRVALGQDLPTLETTPVGELLDRIDGDVNQVSAELRGHGVRLVQAAAMTMTALITALVVWWPAGISMLVLGVLLAVALHRPVQRITPLRMREEEAWSDLAAVMEEAISGQDDVRTSLARPYVLKLLAQRTREVLARGRRVWRLSAQVTTSAVAVLAVGLSLFVVAGVFALATGRIDAARLSSVWLLALAFGGTIEQVSRMVPELQYALGAWGRVVHLRNAPQEPSGGAVPTDGDIEICGLTFSYPMSGADHRPALRNIHLTFRRGRSYALIGRTGSGKSTLAKVLTRAVDIPRGTVFLGGVDLLDLDVEALRRWVAVVPQRTEILAGTLAENIALFDEDLLDAAEKALDELGLSSWVADLPDGMHTRLGEGGYVLSAGQEQLVAFARILVRDPRVVILDEATARMDPVTEARVQEATNRLMQGRIGIIIAHRLSSVRRCDEVVVLADGEVLEAGPLQQSRRFARLLAQSQTVGSTATPPKGRAVAVAAGGPALALADSDEASWLPEIDESGELVAKAGEVLVAQREPVEAELAVPPKTDPPPLPEPAPARTLREIFRLMTNDPTYGLLSVLFFVVMVVLGMDGAVLAWLWADLVDGVGSALWPACGIVVALLVSLPQHYLTGRRYPEWWVRQVLRIGVRLVHGQTGPRRVSKHTPAEVVAQSADTERVVHLADNLVDQVIAAALMTVMTLVSGSFVPVLFFGATILVSGLAATMFGPVLERSARTTVAARAAFSTGLVSALAAARTVKLSGATQSVLAHLARLERTRSDRQRKEIAIQVWARSTPAMASGLLPIGAWALYVSGRLSAGATMVAVATLAQARWFAWTTASLVSNFPSARVWTRRTVAMCGHAAYSATVPGVDISAGTAPAPDPPPRHPLQRLELVGFSAVHEDGTVGVRDINLTVERGQLVLVVGPVGSGKSSLLRALAGIVHHTGELRWNGELVTEPERFLRPNQIGYVAQVPRVLSGTVADNIRLGRDVDAAAAVSTAQLDHDLAATAAGLGLVIGHKGTRLSGGQLQRLALARALAARTELLIADDVSSALDLQTELDLWRALRAHGVTVVGSTSKRAALAQADQVVVLMAGQAVARGTWRDLEDCWGHLAG